MSPTYYQIFSLDLQLKKQEFIAQAATVTKETIFLTEDHNSSEAQMRQLEGQIAEKSTTPQARKLFEQGIALLKKSDALSVKSRELDLKSII